MESLLGVGVLLAGGKSSRMGGADKSLLPLAGRPLIAHVIDRLRPQVADLVVVANGDLSRFAAFGLPVVADRVTGHAGPLAGIHAGLEWARAHRPECPFAITAATDTPFLPTDLVSRFRASLGPGETKLLIARSAAALHPVFGWWPVSLAADLEEALGRGDRKARDWVGKHGAKEVLFPPAKIGGREIDPFFNVNRPEDLDEAEALLSG
jgi:molybdopterin-guanine dinucleotide biosynthesis protein A